MTKLQVEKRLKEWTNIRGDTGCWEWLGGVDDFNYGFLSVDNKKFRIGRLSLWIYKDFDLSSDLMALHIPTCKLKSCWNPDHLYAGTQLENMRDMIKSKTHYYKSKTHCKNGHEFTKENTMVRKDNGGRQCRTCAAIVNARLYKEKIRCRR